VELHQRIEKLQKDRVQAQQSLQTLKNKLEEVEQKYWERKNNLEDLEKQVSQKKERAKESEKNLFILLEEISNKKREEERLKAQKEHQTQRLQELIEEEKELKKILNEKTTFLERSNQLAHQLSLELNDLNKTSGELEKEILQLQRQAEEIKESLLNTRNRIEVCNHNIQLLQRLLETYEDYPEGVRYLMVEQDSISGFKGTLADILSVAPEYKVAIESCLGEAATYLVAEDSEKAYLGINNLKENKKGVVTFLPLDRFSSAQNHPPIALGEKVIGWADELIKTEATFRPAVQALLGNCLVVKDRQVAEKYRTQLSDKRVTVVTLDGEVLMCWGGIKGGSHGNQRDGLIGRTDQLKQFQQEKDHLEILIQNEEIKREQTLKRIEALVQQKDHLSIRAKEVEKEFTNARMNAAQLQFEKGKLEERLTKNKHERTELHNELQRITERQTAGTQAIELAEQKRLQLEEESTILQRNLVELEQQLASLAQEVHGLNLSAVSLKGEYKNLEREIDHNVELARQYQSSIESKDQEILEDIKQKESLTSRLDQLTGELEKDFTAQEQSQKIVQDLERDRGELLRKIDEKGRVIRNLRYDKERTSQTLHELELQISELKLKSENLKQRTKEEHNWDIKEEASFEPLDPQELELQIEGLKGRLKALGLVNMLALKEYQKEKERLDFLKGQQHDLLEAEKNLKETIELINQTARSRFTEIYEKVRKNFAEVFRGFFEQGEADLIINREADPLEADIEVVANPSGKRLNSLSLLSGGEKALTAISLLFAIYLIKPSPFCILDEVDAPLDDSNIERFVRALRKFSNNTQFIVVTHNKLTMKAADCLYGITMSEDAISKVVSVKIESEMA
ncbi:MAG: chromosome segregation protein SMC, partial [candidate division KSB1 bacterium]|nr:chromosome segregation protein SMC [candidate division KSB1 bacterium]